MKVNRSVTVSYTHLDVYKRQVTDHLPGFVYLEMTEKAFAFNAEVKILFQMDRGIEFSDKMYPHALFVPGREQLKSLAKEKMDDMITKNSEKGAFPNENALLKLLYLRAVSYTHL